MLYELYDASKVNHLFEGWKETLIYSCLHFVSSFESKEKYLDIGRVILQCLDEGLYPSWDAQNMISVHLAEKLGYEYDHEYMVYEVSGKEGTYGYEL